MSRFDIFAFGGFPCDVMYVFIYLPDCLHFDLCICLRIVFSWYPWSNNYQRNIQFENLYSFLHSSSFPFAILILLISFLCSISTLIYVSRLAENSTHFFSQVSNFINDFVNDTILQPNKCRFIFETRASQFL